MKDKKNTTFLFRKHITCSNHNWNRINTELKRLVILPRVYPVLQQDHMIKQHVQIFFEYEL